TNSTSAMPSLQLKMKKSEDEIRRLFFDSNLKKASSVRGIGIANPNASHDWTEVSELRLFTKAIHFKPAGVNRHFNLGQLINYMNNIYEDEEDTDFEVFLTPEDFKLYQKRREVTNKADIYIFKPAYKIRPNGAMIMEKMRQFYDMDTVENHEYLPDVFTAKSDFCLEPERVASVDTMKKEDVDRLTPTVARKKMKGDNSRSNSPSMSTLAKRKKALTADESRSASPASTTKKH
ncbi:hypothetical protein PFISCL1PPCAC_23729, partial [Pristionchus fissidentatus]